MKFSKWGEEAFIQYLTTQFSQNGAFGIGDDCAVIPQNEENSWLVTTDALVEGVHFIKEQIQASDLGYKTMAVNVSDIAAMGGTPKYAFLSIAIPKDMDDVFIKDFVDGIKKACQTWDVFLLGGDTVGSKRDLFINVTLIGSAAPQNIKYRHLAQNGDLICVTGPLGNSGGGFRAIQEGHPVDADIKNLIAAHFHPEVYPREGKWLASKNCIHAMMDISDGLNCDLRRIIKRSIKGAIVEIEKIPVSNSLLKVCKQLGWDSINLALTGGEDYCLLFTVSANDFDLIQYEFQKEFGKPIYNIGTITEAFNELVYQSQGNEIYQNLNNYNHFQ